MRLHDPTNFRRLIRHRCQYCGRDFFTDKQTGRPRLFCDKKCKDGEFRRLRYLTFKNVETPQKSEVTSKISKVESGDRPPVLIRPNDPPVNILGGFKFPNAPVVDLNPIPPKPEKQKFSPEQQKRLDEFLAQIPDDLSIPAFLRRTPS
jgi:hypothetical protein